MLLQTIAAIAMLAVLAALLYWQHVRLEIVAECREKGGFWDGAAARCRLLPPIYLERGIKRSGLAANQHLARLYQNRSMR